ncbi:MAG: isoaspartyl peptidase/L-asparaginase family protein [Alphaproteobacteria bacterium]
MRRLFLRNSCAALALCCVLVSPAWAAEPCKAHNFFAVVAHGGALSQKTEDNGRLAFLRKTLAEARKSLAKGAASLDVVETVVRNLEDSGIFNAGKGAIANTAGLVETDASIMDGRDLRTGAVASMTAIKNPVAAARLVMEKSPHVLFAGDRGEASVRNRGAESAPPDYFIRNKGAAADKRTHGTVGAVALDRCGDIAAATSTGGDSGKKPGRVGDSPIIGASTYADNAVGGFSTTGKGEYFIRFSISKDVADRMKYAGMTIQDAMKAGIRDALAAHDDANGGMIGIDTKGNVAMQWNRVGMFRGYATEREAPVVAQYAGPESSRPRPP